MDYKNAFRGVEPIYEKKPTTPSTESMELGKKDLAHFIYWVKNADFQDLDVREAFTRDVWRAGREEAISEFNLNGEHCDCSCENH